MDGPLIFLSIFGMIFTVVGIMGVRQVRRLRRHGLRTVGVVVDNVHVPGGGKAPRELPPEVKAVWNELNNHGIGGPGRGGWVAVIAFTDNRSRQLRFAELRVWRQPRPLGSSVEVIYPSDRPHDAVVKSWSQVGLVLYLLPVPGLFLLASVVAKSSE